MANRSKRSSPDKGSVELEKGSFRLETLTYLKSVQSLWMAPAGGVLRVFARIDLRTDRRCRIGSFGMLRFVYSVVVLVLWSRPTAPVIPLFFLPLDFPNCGIVG